MISTILQSVGTCLNNGASGITVYVTLSCLQPAWWNYNADHYSSSLFKIQYFWYFWLNSTVSIPCLLEFYQIPLQE